MAHHSIGDVGDGLVKDIESWKSRSGVVKINLALSVLLPNGYRLTGI